MDDIAKYYRFLRPDDELLLDDMDKEFLLKHKGKCQCPPINTKLPCIQSVCKENTMCVSICSNYLIKKLKKNW